MLHQFFEGLSPELLASKKKNRSYAKSQSKINFKITQSGIDVASSSSESCSSDIEEPIPKK